MIKKTILFVCLAAASAAAAAILPAKGFSTAQAPQTQITVDKIVANVGNSVILYSDVVEMEQQLIENYRRNGYTPPSNAFYAALEQLLEIKVGYNQALIDSLTINSGSLVLDVEEVLQAQIAEAGSIKALESKYNMPFYDIRSMLSKRLEEQSYYRTMHQTVTEKVKMTPGEVESFFKSFPKDSIPIIPDQYTYAQITKYPPTITEAKQQLRERMLEMRADIISGKTKFETMAVLYSADPESSKRGGELPTTYTKSELESAVWDAVKKLKPGQVSQVTETEEGLRLIGLIEVVGDRYRLRQIIMTPNFTSDEKNAAITKLDSIVLKIRQDSLTFERAALYYSDDRETRMNGGIVTNAELLKYYYGSGQIPAEMKSFRFTRENFIGPYYNDYQTLEQMKTGDISDPYMTRDFKGIAMAKVVKLIEFLPAHEANLAEDYLVIEKSALDKKQSDVYDKWLRKTIESTYIRIDPAYHQGLDPKWLK